MFKTDNKGFPYCQCFPILELPTVVLFHVIEYLNKKEKGILSRVNRQFREIMKSPNHWKNTTFVLSPKKLVQCKHIVSLLSPRKAESVIFSSTCSKEFQRAILVGIPSLRAITTDNPNPSTLELIVSHAKEITKLHLGMVSTQKTPDLTLHFKELENLVDVSLDRHVFKFDVSGGWIGNWGREGFATLKQNSTLKELNLCGSLRSNAIITQTIHWLDTYSSLIYLNLSFSLDERVLRLALLYLYKLPNLKKLDLTKSALQNNMFRENHPKLWSIELKSCFEISGQTLRTLSSVMGNSLQYLGLSNCNRIEDKDLTSLITMFSCLETIDLSGCTGISDMVLFQNFRNGKLRKIILKGCSNVSEEAIQMVRKNTMNKLTVIL
ncbi:uncharacterized protein LOC116304777 [Actinia tenebrosa]|uniref:Uncharacterized protein LOC116304777 n=1 Tax=Actinia tenebrosa TaxID=6105 RepID=A0A6P8IT88_ACTTE|nr:uncharacterized protein LOC116304777 [Actinia tenebrosa]